MIETKSQVKKWTIQIGTGMYMEVEQHPNTDVPELWPECVTEMGKGGPMFLSQLHSKEYQPAAQEKEALIKRIKKASSWCYLTPCDRERE